MNSVRDLRQLPSERSEQERRSFQGILNYDLKNCIKIKERSDIKKLKIPEGLTANIGLPLELVEQHDPWPAYVTYTSPMVKRLIVKSKMRELEYTNAFESKHRAGRSKKPSGTGQMKRRSSKSFGEATLQDALSQAMSPVGGASSADAPEPMGFHQDSSDSPTAAYNKIIFSCKPMTKLLPYSLLLTNKEKHMNA
ncbi:CMT1A duplicated region transcript 4 protein isoform X1 [Ochotona princeps]|uniref:CMT1A duplicated region transcript 4 protein isoform X1 n=1 Tax=Ochotona princeps TaxID=9978 RepID=UPI0027152259|nr:CMT1A duplicated region transcript 4 protein isoform X1 [Ochotona princeps]